MNMLLLIVLSVVNFIIYYYFFYYLLYYIKNEVNIARAAGVLLILFSLALITCPLVVSAVFAHMKMLLMPKMM